MTQDQGIGVIWGIGWIALVGSSLVARRLPAGRVLKMAAIWVAIFAVGLLIVSLRGRVHLPWQHDPAPAAPLSTREELT